MTRHDYLLKWVKALFKMVKHKHKFVLLKGKKKVTRDLLNQYIKHCWATMTTIHNETKIIYSSGKSYT